jgi:hypothetical protein
VESVGLVQVLNTGKIDYSLFEYSLNPVGRETYTSLATLHLADTTISSHNTPNDVNRGTLHDQREVESFSFLFGAVRLHQCL